MNKKLITSVFLFLVATIAYSQRFDGGALLGFNATQVEGDTFKGYHKPGLVAGFYVQTDLSSVFFAAMEIKYSQFMNVIEIHLFTTTCLWQVYYNAFILLCKFYIYFFK